MFNIDFVNKDEFAAVLLSVVLSILVAVGREQCEHVPNSSVMIKRNIRINLLSALLGVVSVSVSFLLAAFALAALASFIIVEAGVCSSRDLDKAKELRSFDISFLLMFCIGSLILVSPVTATFCALLLAFSYTSLDIIERFINHRFASRDFVRGVSALAIGFMVVQIIPSQPIGPLGLINLHEFVMLLLTVSALKVLVDIYGKVFPLDNHSIILGLLSGFASSSATIFVIGRLQRRDGKTLNQHALGALASTGSTIILIILICFFQSREIGSKYIFSALAASFALVGHLAAVRFLLFKVAEADTPIFSPVRFHYSDVIVFTLLTFLMSISVYQLQSVEGRDYALLSASLAGFLDAHAVAYSLVSSHLSELISAQQLSHSLFIAIISNAASKVLIAFISGGLRFGMLVSSQQIVLVLILGLM